MFFAIVPAHSKAEAVSQPASIGKFFKVVPEKLGVYDNRSGSLELVGYLEGGQTYSVVSESENWYGISFDDYVGYVLKASTTLSTQSEIGNHFPSSTKSFIGEIEMIADTKVYDNSSGGLVAFGTLPAGNPYSILGISGDWYKVELASRVGYIHKSSVELVFSDETKYFKINNAQEPIFLSNNGHLSQVGSIYDGQVYHQTKDVGNWHGIQFGNKTAYIHKSKTSPVIGETYQPATSIGSRYFTVTDPVNIYQSNGGKLSPYVHLKTGEQYPINSDYGNWYKVVAAGKETFVLKSAVKEEFTPATEYFKTLEEVVVYDNESGSLEPIGTLNKDQAFDRIKDYGNWHQIQFGQKYGYVLKSSTEPAIKSDLMSPVTGSVIGYGTTSTKATVYDNSTSTLIPFATLEKDQKVRITKNYGNWYEISLSGRKGYVSKAAIPDYQPISQDIVNPRQVYTYEEMKRDIGKLQEMYPGLIQTTTIGKSVDGRNLYAVKLGTGKTEITINGSHHAREHISTNVLMEMIDEYAQAYTKGQLFDGYNPRTILTNSSIWFIPMVNPDGVSLVQLGHTSAKNPGYVLSLNGGSTNFSSWKANIRGVDLNRQYPLNWSKMESKSKPGPENYKGTKPLSEPESKALYDFTMSKDFKTAVAYHTSGSILYWSYLTDSELMNQNKVVAEAISRKTGYPLMTPGEGFGYYDDWFISQFRRPAFTPEISPYVGPQPVPLKNYDDIWRRNDSVGLMLAKEAYENKEKR
jgi:murein tripeptide amidase MpaA